MAKKISTFIALKMVTSHVDKGDIQKANELLKIISSAMTKQKRASLDTTEISIDDEKHLELFQDLSTI